MANHPMLPNIRKPFHISSAKHTAINAWLRAMGIHLARVLAGTTTLAVPRTQQE